MPNGDEYALMETEADRILYRRYHDIADRVKSLDNKLNAIIILLLTTLGGVITSMIKG